MFNCFTEPQKYYDLPFGLFFQFELINSNYFFVNTTEFIFSTLQVFIVIFLLISEQKHTLVMSILSLLARYQHHAKISIYQ